MNRGKWLKCEREESRKRPYIWHYSKEEKGERKELVLNPIEITVPWNDSLINEGKFKRQVIGNIF
jgi:hypothetical protein